MLHQQGCVCMVTPPAISRVLPLTTWKKTHQSLTPPKTNIAPENGWLEYYFPFGMAYSQVQTVSFRKGKDDHHFPNRSNQPHPTHPIPRYSQLQPPKSAWGVRARFHQEVSRLKHPKNAWYSDPPNCFNVHPCHGFRKGR